MIRLFRAATAALYLWCSPPARPPASRSASHGNASVVLVAGATGGTGQEVVEQAIAKGLYRPSLGSRRSQSSPCSLGIAVQYVVGDVREPRSLKRAVKGADQVISALGANVQRDPENSPERVDYAGVKALAEAAKAGGVSQFILVSSMGVTHPDHQLNAMLDNILSWKLKGEDAVRATGINYTIVRPGELTNEPAGRRGVRITQGGSDRGRRLGFAQRCRRDSGERHRSGGPLRQDLRGGRRLRPPAHRMGRASSNGLQADVH